MSELSEKIKILPKDLNISVVKLCPFITLLMELFELLNCFYVSTSIKAIIKLRLFVRPQSKYMDKSFP